MPFEGSRRLPGPSLWLDAPGVALEAPAALVTDDALARWRTLVGAMRAALGWPAQGMVARVHRAGATLAFEAPVPALLTATELNEWAWLAALAGPSPHGPGQATHDVASALPLLRLLEQLEPPANLLALLGTAASRGVPLYHDDTDLTIGSGCWSRTWPMDALPDALEVPWGDLRVIPCALVGGSNGKTTTVRLVSAMCAAHGWHTGHSSTDGVRVDGVPVEEGDWAGPAGARLVLSDRRVEAAVLETARGGILRRGLAVTGARAAVITNIQLDHFGEYGIDDLAALTAVKMVVAKGLAAGGLLVLNADDPCLVAAAEGWRGRVAWFSLDEESPPVAAARATAAPWAALAGDGSLRMSVEGATVTLGDAASLPLAVGGLARYNIANALGAALVASGLGVGVDAIRRVLAHFGAERADNPGRLVRWNIDGATILLDYAHNPDGLSGLLDVAAALRGVDGRLIVLLGQAGNREDEDIRAMARTVAAAGPARVVLKEMEEMLRGRAPGEVPRLLADALRVAGLRDDAVESWPTEVEGARAAVRAARPGDVVVLPVHARSARDAVTRWLDEWGGAAVGPT